MNRNTLISCCALLTLVLVAGEYGCGGGGSTLSTDGGQVANGGSTGGGGVGNGGSTAQGGTGQGGNTAQGGTGQGGNTAQGGTGQGGAVATGGTGMGGRTGMGGAGMLPACPANPAGMNCPTQGDQCRDGANDRCFCFAIGVGTPTWRCATGNDGGITIGDVSIAMCPAGTADAGRCDGTVIFCAQNGGGCRCRNMRWTCF